MWSKGWGEIFFCLSSQSKYINNRKDIVRASWVSPKNYHYEIYMGLIKATFQDIVTTRMKNIQQPLRNSLIIIYIIIKYIGCRKGREEVISIFWKRLE